MNRISVDIASNPTIYDLNISYDGMFKVLTIMPTTDGFDRVAEEIGKLVEKTSKEMRGRDKIHSYDGKLP